MNNALQGILETGAPPQSEIVTVKLQQKVSSGTGELTVVRLTERDILLQPAAGQATRVPLAGFEYYRS